MPDAPVPMGYNEAERLRRIEERLHHAEQAPSRFVGWRLTRTTDQTALADDSWSTVQFDTVALDSGGYSNGGANKILVPAGLSGVYLMGVTLALVAAGGALHWQGLRMTSGTDGSTWGGAYGFQDRRTIGYTHDPYMTLSVQVLLEENTYYHIESFRNSGGTYDVKYAGGVSPLWWGMYLHPTYE